MHAESGSASLGQDQDTSHPEGNLPGDGRAGNGKGAQKSHKDNAPHVQQMQEPADVAPLVIISEVEVTAVVQQVDTTDADEGNGGGEDGRRSIRIQESIWCDGHHERRETGCTWWDRSIACLDRGSGTCTQSSVRNYPASLNAS